ncbi:MAG: hypothetical protein A3C84_04345 [Candidatus Ryanbacteria bacterium RIFCSPHIGHO2_02_FULL_48_12]|uniref:Uncharacterized protein n=1 Tax=Candidatus Ryanbacteria bacterium RIFCSPHIGHO2_01_FULL_48_27 TaxID=1802115 RepID=A0A1G2G5G8_9BACT|nr:MAG: hypothetical protein A2756_00615 [Candidatus Ryanbacteria bacterium RIFCSPHIGHO2_01_FULL_48_27]OGZ48593.1 MAG: hypothetical protein A3C84_04345 [Candidatus Ryanbacteria bacterium RIFCSPHIGHO2_02_FULL_48_12]
MKYEFSHAVHASRTYIKTHRILSFISLLAIAGLGYWVFSSYTSTTDETRYITALAKKGSVIASVTGSGQVSASNQIDLKAKVSGEVTYLPVKNGQDVKAGALIAQLDAREAQKTVRDAEANLQSAKISLEKLKQPTEKLSIIQAQNTLARAKESKQNAEDDLQKAYEDGFNAITNAFLDLPSVMTGLQDILYSSIAGLSPSGQWNIDYYANAVEKYSDQINQYKTTTATRYQTARTAYDKSFQDYKSTSRTSDPAVIEAFIAQTYQTTRDISEAVKSASNFIQLYEDLLTEHHAKAPAIADMHLTNLNTYTGKTNTHLTNLLAAEKAIEDDRAAILNAERTINESTESLAKLEAGSDELDIASAQLTVEQRQNALLDAQEKLADYSIRAPFDGTVAKVNIKKADTLSSGVVTATLVTKQKLAEISLNEVDAAKIQVGQKATLTFDAVEGLGITGAVAEIDTVGTVTQGVVTYAVKIRFDTQDERVKSGMSVSAAIITDTRQDVLTIPNSAIKSEGDLSYVEVFDTPLPDQGSQGAVSKVLPRQQIVGIGLSDDTTTEIISGLQESAQVVTRTIAPSITGTPQQTPSLFGSPGGTRTIR